MNKPNSQPPHHLGKSIEKGINNISFESGPFTGKFSTYRGDIDIHKEFKKLIEQVQQYCESVDYEAFLKSGGAEVQDLDKHMKEFLIPALELQHITKIHAALNTQQYLRKFGKSWKNKTAKKDIDNLVIDALNTMAYNVIDPFHDELRDKSFSPQYAGFLNSIVEPSLMHFIHYFAFEWLNQGGDIVKAGTKGNSLKMFYMQPPLPNNHLLNRNSLSPCLAQEYTGMRNTIGYTHQLLNKVVSDEDVQRTKEKISSFLKTLPAKEAFRGWKEQQEVLYTLDWQKKLEDEFNDYLSTIIMSGNEGVKLPDVLYKNIQGSHSCFIEINQGISRYSRKQNQQGTVLPMIYIFTNEQEKLQVEMASNSNNQTVLRIDPSLFVIQASGRRSALPVELMRSTYGLPREKMQSSPQISFFDIARHYPGALSWAERILIPAMEQLAEMYLDAEEFESSEEFIKGLEKIAHDVDVTEEKKTEEKIQSITLTDWQKETVETKAPQEELPSIFFSHEKNAVFYLRKTKKDIAATDRNKSLYKELTGKELPEAMVLREIPFSSSNVTWKDVESVLTNYFNLEKVGQTGSHMQYIRHVNSPSGNIELHGTILAHYSHQAKKGTLHSVLKSFHIPEAIFWILVSKKYKTVKVPKSEILDLSEDVAAEIYETL